MQDGGRRKRKHNQVGENDSMEVSNVGNGIHQRKIYTAKTNLSNNASEKTSENDGLTEKSSTACIESNTLKQQDDNSFPNDESNCGFQNGKVEEEEDQESSLTDSAQTFKEDEDTEGDRAMSDNKKQPTPLNGTLQLELKQKVEEYAQGVTERLSQANSLDEVKQYLTLAFSQFESKFDVLENQKRQGPLKQSPFHQIWQSI